MIPKLELLIEIKVIVHTSTLKFTHQNWQHMKLNKYTFNPRGNKNKKLQSRKNTRK